VDGWHVGSLCLREINMLALADKEGFLHDLGEVKVK
jgi:hypothetical protein